MNVPDIPEKCEGCPLVTYCLSELNKAEEDRETVIVNTVEQLGLREELEETWGNEEVQEFLNDADRIDERILPDSRKEEIVRRAMEIRKIKLSSEKHDELAEEAAFEAFTAVDKRAEVAQSSISLLLEGCVRGAKLVPQYKIFGRKVMECGSRGKPFRTARRNYLRYWKSIGA